MPDFGNTSVFSMVDASNNSVTMPGWNGAAAPSTIDDAGRAFQGAVTRQWNWLNYTITSAGTANAKTLTYSVAPAAYYDGQIFRFISATINTGSVTLDVNSKGAKTIKYIDGAGALQDLVSGMMPAGLRVEVHYFYNGGTDYFVWTNPPKGLLLLSTLATTSGTTVSLTGIPTYIRALYCEIEGVSFTAAATLTIALSGDNGSSYGTAQNVAAVTASGAGLLGGSVWVDNIQSAQTYTIVRPSTIVLSGPTVYTTAVGARTNGGNGPVNAIQFAGGTFDAGSIKVYGLV